jgi:hypothetical protein
MQGNFNKQKSKLDSKLRYRVLVLYFCEKHDTHWILDNCERVGLFWCRSLLSVVKKAATSYDTCSSFNLDTEFQPNLITSNLF